MSFSFNVTGKSTSEVMQKVEEEIAKVTAQQKDHELDAGAVYDVVDTYLDLLDVQEGQTISASVSGSLGWVNNNPAKPNTDESERHYTGAGINVSVRCYKES